MLGGTILTVGIFLHAFGVLMGQVSCAAVEDADQEAFNISFLVALLAHVCGVILVAIGAAMAVSP